jgi:hypothetical protein
VWLGQEPAQQPSCAAHVVACRRFGFGCPMFTYAWQPSSHYLPAQNLEECRSSPASFAALAGSPAKQTRAAVANKTARAPMAVVTRANSSKCQSKS